MQTGPPTGKDALPKLHAPVAKMNPLSDSRHEQVRMLYTGLPNVLWFRVHVVQRVMTRRTCYRAIYQMRAALELRSVVSFGLLFAFSLFSYVTQTHIHIPALERTAVFEVPDQSAHHKRPLDDDTAHCPWCQAAVMSGSFVVPIAPALPVPAVLTITEFLPFSFVLGGMLRSHGWQSRAPPRK